MRRILENNVSSAHHSGSGISLYAPNRQTSALVIASPHSGRCYSPEFLRMVRLGMTALRRSEDCFVDELFSDARGLGTPFLCALFPRCFVDVNRSPAELDRKMFTGVLPFYSDTKSERVISGMGVIPRLAASGAEIYPQLLPISIARQRLLGHYFPYHKTLRQLLMETREQFGHAILLDCHSMPSKLFMGRSEPTFDIVLGDRHGKSCSSYIIDKVETVLVGQGYTVGRNTPYAGGFTSEYYGHPKHGIDVLQIEISRALYMDERALRRSPGMPMVRANMASLIENLGQSQSLTQAAE